jgi:hypothetical protein
LADIRGLHDYGDAARLDCLVNRERDLFGQSLLDLETAGERFRDPRELREAEDQLVGDVGNGDLVG